MADVDISSVFDSVGVAEWIDAGLSDLAVNVYDSVSVAEDYDVVQAWYIDVYDSVSIAEWGYVVSKPWRMNSNIPGHELTASFATAMQLSATLPIWEFAGQFGFRLNEKLPTRDFSGSMSEDSVGFTMNSKLPTWSVDGKTGSRLSSYIPVGGISGSFEMTYVMSLNEKIPLLTLTATMYENGLFSLDQNIPVRSLVASMVITEEQMTLDEKIPGALKLSASMYESGGITLSETLPAWSVKGSMYGEGFQVSSYLPVLTLDASMVDTKPEVDPDGDITEDSFVGVLRYIRP